MRAAARDVFCIQLSVETLRTAPGNRRCNTESAHVAATATIWERHSRSRGLCQYRFIRKMSGGPARYNAVKHNMISSKQSMRFDLNRAAPNPLDNTGRQAEKSSASRH